MTDIDLCSVHVFISPAIVCALCNIAWTCIPGSSEAHVRDSQLECIAVSFHSEPPFP
jgi:hypothetical protein